MNKSYDIKYKLLISLFLVVSILVVYQQMRTFDFVNFDDDRYISENSQVKAGLTVKGVIWAFSSFSSANWHPLTWLSHMLDCELYGLNPMGHHWTNLQLHMANTLLLFFIFYHMTRALWQSAFVAALFALHPLHVESVAWVAERKDVLSTFFGMLAIWSYLRYIKHPRIINYLLIMLFLSFGLMAKPMLVTLPFVLLLLDYWPLKRLHDNTSQQHSGSSKRFIRLVWEKIPLLVLVSISSVLTFVAQHYDGAVGSLKSFSIQVRISNALVSYVSYVYKTIWPRNLSVFYPHPGDTLPIWQSVGAVFLIAGACFLAIRTLKSYPYIAVGLFWYLGTLVPVIGLIQVGEQAMADRYTYLPLTGLFIVVAWGVSDLFRKWRIRKIVLWVSAAIIISSLAMGTFYRLRHWENGITLFEAAIKADNNNYLAYNNLGTAHGQKNLDKAIFYYKEALKIKPDYVTALYNLGTALSDTGSFDEAILYLTKALRVNPENIDARSNLANLLFIQGDPEKAVFQYNEILKINPEYADAHSNLANVLTVQERLDEAVFHYKQALRINPEHTDAHYNLGTLLVKQKKTDQAVVHFSETIKIDPDYVKAYNYIGVILAQKGKPKKAGLFFSKAIQIRPDYSAARKNLEILKQTALSGNE